MKAIYLKFVLLLFLSGIITSVNAQSGPAWVWAVTNNAPGTGNGAGLVTDAAGNVYTAGFSLSKHNQLGTLLWSKNLSNTGQITVKGLANDAAGNLYLAGYFGGTIQFDTVTLTTYGHSDIFIVKFNTNGQVQWARHAGGPGPPPGFPPSPGAIYDAAWAVAADSAGNCYLTGICEHNAQFDTVVTAFSNTNRFVAKYNAQGSIQWVRPVPQEASGIAVDQQGGYFLTGRFSTVTASGVFCEKYNANGSLIWSKQATGNNCYGKSISIDALGNCFITGSVSDTISFDNFTVTPPSNGRSMFLVKYNSAGTVQWANQTTGSNCGGENVVTDNQGNAYVTGGMYGNVNFSSSVQLNGVGGGWPDIYAAKYNPNGNLEWALQAGTGGSDYGQAIGALPNGDVYVAGTHQSGCTFGNISLAGSHANNFFVAKISASPLGVAEKKVSGNIKLYPNPVASTVTISAEDTGKGTLSVYNSFGQAMYNAPLKPENSFSVANWPRGMYLVKLTSNGKSQVRKLAVTK